MENGGMAIQKSSDYKIFKFLAGNRKISNAQVSRLKQSIEDNNLTGLRPLIVNEKMQIIDGQHTFLACKEMNYPIHYIVHTGASLKDVQSLNSSNRNWGGGDYLYMYCQKGNKNYLALNEFMERWRFNLWDAIHLLMNGGSINGTQFRNGNFVVGDIDLANKYAEMIYEFSPFTDHFRKRSFIKACQKIFKLRSYKQKQMIAALEKIGKKIPTCDDQMSYLKELDKIYNYGQEVKYSIYLQSK